MTDIAGLEWRRPARVTGRVRSIRVQPWAGVPSLQCTLVDRTGGLIVVFLGRRRIAGIRPGCRMTVEGVVGAHQGHMAVINPDYDIISCI